MMQHSDRFTSSEEQAVRLSSRGSNQSGMRAYNERLVLSLIRESGALAKAEIARITGLSAQTVSVIMRSLEAEGLLQKGKPVRGKVGQPSVPMNLDRKGAYFLGFKIGRRSLDLVLIDFLGRVEGRISRTIRYPMPGNTVLFVNEAIGQLLEQLPKNRRSRVAGLGIAMPFRLWDWAGPLGIRPEDMIEWQGFDIVSEIDRNWDFPVFLCNDASAACGAELVFGEQNKPRDFLYFFIGFFVGGGLVLDGSLYTGRTGNAAALGSMPTGSNNSKIRQLVDVAALATLEKMLLSEGHDADVIWRTPESWSVPAKILEQWLQEACDGLAYAILSSACLIDFECVLIDGWLPDDIRATVVERTQQRLTELALAGIDTPEVREGTIGSDARSLGAASLPLSERFLIDRKAFLKG